MPPFRRAAFALFCVIFFGSLLLSDRSFYSVLLLDWSLQEPVAWWSPLSGLFFAPPEQLLTVAWALVLQWSIGSELESRIGSWRFLLVVLLSALGGELSAFGIGPLLPAEYSGVTVNGALCAQVATVVVFGVVAPKEEFRPFGISPMSGAWWAILLGVVLVVWPMVEGLGGVLGVISALVSALLAGVGARFLARPDNPRKKPKKSHLRVVRRAEDMLH